MAARIALVGTKISIIIGANHAGAPTPAQSCSRVKYASISVLVTGAPTLCRNLATRRIGVVGRENPKSQFRYRTPWQPGTGTIYRYSTGNRPCIDCDLGTRKNQFHFTFKKARQAPTPRRSQEKTPASSSTHTTARRRKANARATAERHSSARVRATARPARKAPVLDRIASSNKNVSQQETSPSESAVLSTTASASKNPAHRSTHHHHRTGVRLHHHQHGCASPSASTSACEREPQRRHARRSCSSSQRPRRQSA